MKCIPSIKIYFLMHLFIISMKTYFLTVNTFFKIKNYHDHNYLKKNYQNNFQYFIYVIEAKK
jgi:hypothetical protein